MRFERENFRSTTPRRPSGEQDVQVAGSTDQKSGSRVRPRRREDDVVREGNLGAQHAHPCGTQRLEQASDGAGALVEEGLAFPERPGRSSSEARMGTSASQDGADCGCPTFGPVLACGDEDGLAPGALEGSAHDRLDARVHPGAEHGCARGHGSEAGGADEKGGGAAASRGGGRGGVRAG